MDSSVESFSTVNLRIWNVKKHTLWKLSTNVSFWSYNFSVSMSIYIHHRFATNMLMLWTGQKQKLDHYLPWTCDFCDLWHFSSSTGYIENPKVSVIHPQKSFLLGGSADALSLSILTDVRNFTSEKCFALVNANVEPHQYPPHQVDRRLGTAALNKEAGKTHWAGWVGSGTGWRKKTTIEWGTMTARYEFKIIRKNGRWCKVYTNVNVDTW